MSDENYIFVGPTIAKLGIRRSMIVLGSTPPPQIQNLIDLEPAVRSLFIPTSECATARIKVRTEGTLENLAVQRIFELKARMEKVKPIERVERKW